MLTELGFRSVHKVSKTRTIFSLDWEGRHLEITFDRVDQVGDYLEIETMATEADRDQARDTILGLASRLGFTHPERRSYLRLLGKAGPGRSFSQVNRILPEFVSFVHYC
ncbi:MAG: CYTH domain-containing protein [Planctomycetaceae bacterium]